jgi:hypothetical protein
VGDEGVAGVAVDDLGDHAFALRMCAYSVASSCQQALGPRRRLYARSVWSWRYIRGLGWDGFAWLFVIVVPLTSCTAWFWLAANKNLEQLDRGPLVIATALLTQPQGPRLSGWVPASPVSSAAR